MSLNERIYSGERAKEVLDNEAFAQVFTDIEQEITSQWISSPARDAEGREKLWQYLTLLHKVKSQLTQSLESGKLARLDLTHQQTLQERAKNVKGAIFGR